ncbi:hypothetical protein B0J14DRAFT_614523 [Halenospora varia]|nr:hypothetical protein B0J14DRAFT_614523 [Halenospora varia]
MQEPELSSSGSLTSRSTESMELDGFEGNTPAEPRSPPRADSPLIKRPRAQPKVRGVPIGVWRDSSEPDDNDKHVIFGFIDIHDRLRTRIYAMNKKREELIGNVPTGAGGCWVTFPRIIFERHLASLNSAEIKEYVKLRTDVYEATDEERIAAEGRAVALAKQIASDQAASPVVMEPHLQGLSRPEVKEYCRIRNYEQEQRESEKERKANELKAVQTAKATVASQAMNGELTQAYSPRAAPPPLEMETRHSARAEHKHHARQQAEIEAATARARQEKLEATERQHEKTRKEVAAAENNIIEHAAQMELKHNLKKLNKVWVAQKNATHSQSASSNGGTVGGPPPVSDEIKYHNGIKYERKQNGPFAGKLVGPPQILSIDGEDYVEYRILTKPSF